jgi:hypothetical protein
MGFLRRAGFLSDIPPRPTLPEAPPATQTAKAEKTPFARGSQPRTDTKRP